jgi:hypothetical protein
MEKDAVCWSSWIGAYVTALRNNDTDAIRWLAHAPESAHPTDTHFPTSLWLRDTLAAYRVHPPHPHTVPEHLCPKSIPDHSYTRIRKNSPDAYPATATWLEALLAEHYFWSSPLPPDHKYMVGGYMSLPGAVGLGGGGRCFYCAQLKLRDEFEDFEASANKQCDVVYRVACLDCLKKFKEEPDSPAAKARARDEISRKSKSRRFQHQQEKRL